jgi:light-regulated signal transduction histidine kinase (bacteriophytochrome)
VPFLARATAEVFGRLLSLQIEALGHRDQATLRAARKGAQDAFAMTIRVETTEADVLQSLLSCGEDLLRLVGAHGARFSGKCRLRQSCGRSRRGWMSTQGLRPSRPRSCRACMSLRSP